MTTESLAGCVLSLSANDLSAWRDGAIDDAKKARLDTHIPGCDACSARIGAYEDIARALRAIPTPEPLHGYGRNPRTHGTSAAERRAPIWHRREFSGLGAVAAIALLLLAFAQVFGRLGAVQSPSVTATPSPTPMATTTATATAMPVPRLALRPITLPPGFHVQSNAISANNPMNEPPLAVSPVDGKDAWACLPTGGGAFQIWATTDEGATWHAAGLLHPPTPTPSIVWGMVADQRDTQAAAFVVEWWFGSGAASYLYSMSFYTRDGGAHWRQLPGWTRVFTVDTDGANSYALIAAMTPPLAQRQQQQQSALLEGISPPRFSAPGFGPFSPDYAKLVVSSDGWQTWRELHPGGANTGDPPLRFWHGPTSGDLFVATVSGAFWHSSDGGVSWTQSTTLDTPDMQDSLGIWLASRKAWMFCAWQSSQPLVVICSTDTGNTWEPTPALTSACQTVALEMDGSLLAACTFDGIGRAAYPIATYRLAPNATNWTALGQVPSIPTVSANGIMWCLNTGGSEWEAVTLPS